MKISFTKLKRPLLIINSKPADAKVKAKELQKHIVERGVIENQTELYSMPRVRNKELFEARVDELEKKLPEFNSVVFVDSQDYPSRTSCIETIGPMLFGKHKLTIAVVSPLESVEEQLSQEIGDTRGPRNEIGDEDVFFFKSIIELIAELGE